MSVIEYPEAKTNPTNEEQSVTDDQLRLEAIRLLLAVPKEGLDSVLKHLKTVIQTHSQSNDVDAKEDEEPKRGTMGSLLKFALDANISFDDPDLSEHTKEFMQNEFTKGYEERMKRNEQVNVD